MLDTGRNTENYHPDDRVVEKIGNNYYYYDVSQ